MTMQTDIIYFKPDLIPVAIFDNSNQSSK